MLCERCQADNPEGTVVCSRCYYAVGIPYAPGGKPGKKKDPGKAPAWAVEMGMTEYESRQVISQLGDSLKGKVVIYWFGTREDAAETQKALADTIGKELQSKKVKAGVFGVQGRTALFVAGSISDLDTVKMVCESFNGQPAMNA